MTSYLQWQPTDCYNCYTTLGITLGDYSLLTHYTLTYCLVYSLTAVAMWCICTADPGTNDCIFRSNDECLHHVWLQQA